QLFRVGGHHVLEHAARRRFTHAQRRRRGSPSQARRASSPERQRRPPPRVRAVPPHSPRRGLRVLSDERVRNAPNGRGGTAAPAKRGETPIRSNGSPSSRCVRFGRGRFARTRQYVTARG